MRKPVFFAAHHEPLPIGKECNALVIDPLDIPRITLIVNHPSRYYSGIRPRTCCQGRRIAQQQFEMVLRTIQPVDEQTSGGRPFDPRNILVGLFPGVDAAAPAAFQIVVVYFDDRILFARLGIFERIVLRIQVPFETVHVVLPDPALVEPHPRQVLSVGRPGECA